MTQTLEQYLAANGHAGGWNYPLSATTRAALSRGAALSYTPILQSFNEVYGYWCTERDLSRNEVIQYLGTSYLSNMNNGD